jgi:hypothetical protein
MQQMKSFENWLTQEVEDLFGLEEVEKHPLLETWLHALPALDLIEEAVLDKLRPILATKVKYWNEDELKFQFIAPLIYFLDFGVPKFYTVFTQRNLSATVKTVSGQVVEIKGRVEWLIASGKQVPKTPFLFIHEYKPHLKSTPSDPKGQLLIAMYAAQALNAPATHPIYGAYVMGQHWYFVFLKEGQYAESRAYDATQTEQLKAIFAILKQAKAYIHQILKISK